MEWEESRSGTWLIESMADAAPIIAARATHIPWTPERVRWTGGLMLALLVAAMDSTIVGTALPTIGGELGNFSLYPWVFSGYLLTATTTVPLWGKLADLYGRKVVMFVGLGIFVGASVLCGMAHSMLALVLFRALQGLGAGCLQPVAMTVIGDLFPLQQRARVQGLFSGMWALAAISGPLLGALFVSTIGWRWIFDVNVPIGLAAAALLWSFNDRVRGGRVSIDYAGALLLTAGVGLLLFGFGSGNSDGQLNWPLIAVSVLMLGAFVVVERRAPSPTVPMRFLVDPVIGPAVVVAVIVGTLLFGLTSYVPLLVQAGLGGSAFAAGAAIAPLMVGWPVAGMIAGRVMLRVGYQRLALLGAVVIFAGCAMLLVPATVAPVAPVIWLSGAMLLIGIGMGVLNTPLLIVLQSVVDWSDRGAVTALNQFSRTIGGAVGVALMGLLLETRMQAEAAARGLDPSRFADPSRLSTQTAAGRSLVVHGIQAVDWVFVALSLLAIVVAAMIVLGSRGRRLAFKI
jgi:EmrB/QacA subfamily drug resistance transporter